MQKVERNPCARFSQLPGRDDMGKWRHIGRGEFDRLDEAVFDAVENHAGVRVRQIQNPPIAELPLLCRVGVPAQDKSCRAVRRSLKDKLLSQSHLRSIVCRLVERQSHQRICRQVNPLLGGEQSPGRRGRSRRTRLAQHLCDEVIFPAIAMKRGGKLRHRAIRQRMGAFPLSLHLLRQRLRFVLGELIGQCPSQHARAVDTHPLLVPPIALVRRWTGSAL